MINVEKNTLPRANFHSLLAPSPTDLATESFQLSGNSTHISNDPTLPHALHFSPEDPSLKLPHRRGKFSEAGRDNILCLLASPDGRFGSLKINARTQIHTCLLGTGHQITYRIRPDHSLWIRPQTGSLSINGQTIQLGESARIISEKEITISSLSTSEFLLLTLWE